MSAHRRYRDAESRPITVEAPLRSSQPIDLKDLRARRRVMPLRPYDQLDIAPWPDAKRLKKRADEIIQSGWSIAGTLVTRLDPPIVWSGYPRSISFHLNAWEPLSRLLAAYTITRERRYFDVAYAAALDWMKTFQVAALKTKTIAELDDLIGKPEDFVWYDMSVGQRCYRLAYLLDEALRCSESSDEEILLLLDGLYFHHAALSRDHFFRSNNNHGLFQALGQWAAARRFMDLEHMSIHAKLGERRMKLLFAQHFFESGVHKEHSPGYHYLMLQTFIGAKDSDLLADDYWRDRLERMERALVWMIMPDHNQATIGDSDPRTMLDLTASARYSDPQLKYIASGGRDGTPPPVGVKVYQDAGYVFSRLLPASNTQLADASYLALMAGFHSTTHKHADHLSVLWYDRGQLVLADPGRYGYSGKSKAGSELAKAGFRYDDPKRIYVESTRAHNTVQIDGRDHVRTQILPWGSAIVSAEMQGDLMVAECEIRHVSSVRHRRIIIQGAGEFLLVLDWLGDSSGSVHSYVQRFIFAPHWDVSASDTGAVARGNGHTLHVLSLTSCPTLQISRGQTEPELLGWVSERANELTPASTLAFTLSDTSTACFVTLFAFGEKARAEFSDQRISQTLTSASLKWRVDGAERSIDMTRGHGKKIEVLSDRTVEVLEDIYRRRDNTTAFETL